MTGIILSHIPSFIVFLRKLFSIVLWNMEILTRIVWARMT